MAARILYASYPLVTPPYRMDPPTSPYMHTIDYFAIYTAYTRLRG